jgi:hypothetical protein
MTPVKFIAEDHVLDLHADGRELQLKGMIKRIAMSAIDFKVLINSFFNCVFF